MTSAHPFVRFHIGSRAFLERARGHLSAFRASEDAAPSLFYAALELRFGIEARVTEYLQTAMKNLGRDASEVNDYVATKLLKRLTQIEPNYEQGGGLRITNEQNGHQTILEFTPVTRELARLHGKLGELLHYKFFLNNKHWQLKKPMGGQPHRSIGDFADMVDGGIAQLGEATRGLLLGHMRFTEIVSEVLGEEAKDDV